MIQRRDDLQRPATAAMRARAFGVHIFTSLGVAIALIALLEAVREHWAAMFGWLGFALLIDAIDGPLARALKVKETLPNWSGDTLDLVVDFTTYVFVPAYAITASGLLVPIATPLLGAAIVISGALYFSDTRMKTDDNHFRGFPALWNAAAFYLFLLKPSPMIGSIMLGTLVILTFAPFNVMHPVRTQRLKYFNLGIMMIWAVLAIMIVIFNFNVPPAVTIMSCLTGFYILFSDVLIRLFSRKRA